jgi:tetratricopeptide (TPR) repeat protein
MNDNDTQGLRIIYNKFACLYIAMQQYTKVIEYCQKLISISQPNSIHLGMCYGNAGIAYMKLGYYEMAEKCFTLELDIAQTIQNRSEEANAIHRLGLLHYRKGERIKGDQCFQQALEIAKSIGAVRIEEQILKNIELKKEEDDEYVQLEAKAIKFSDECNHFIFDAIEKNGRPGTNGKCTEITVKKYQPIIVKDNFAIFDFSPKTGNVATNYEELSKQLKISLKGQYQTIDWFDVHRTFGECYEAREGTNIQLVVRNESNLDCTIFIVYVNFEGNIITLSFVDGYQRVIAKRSMKHLTIGALERVPDQSKKICLVKTFAQFHGFTPFLVCTQPIIVTQ